MLIEACDHNVRLTDRPHIHHGSHPNLPRGVHCWDTSHRKKFRMRLVISLALITTLASACSLETSTDPNINPSKKAVGRTGDGKKAAPKDGLHVVVYEMGGTASKADLTWTTPSGIEQEGDAKVPWKKTLKAKDGTAMSISGQNKGGGTITCTITVDGKQVKAAKSKGLYQIASCDGIIGF